MDICFNPLAVAFFFSAKKRERRGRGEIHRQKGLAVSKCKRVKGK